MTVSDEIHAAGKEIHAAAGADIATAMNAALHRFIGDRFGVAPGSIIDAKGNRSPTFGSVIHVGKIEDLSQPIPADAAAAVIDICDDLTIEQLRQSYRRISEAKRLAKTPVPKGETRTNITLGVLYAARTGLPLEVIGEEVDRLNKQTPGQFWPDMFVVGGVGTINYGVQFPGEGVSGDYLPPAEGALANYTPAIYVVPVMRPTGTHTFNKMLGYVLPHLGIYLPSGRETLPVLDEVLRGVSKHAVTLGGYQYNLRGELVPVPREQYNDRYLAPRPLLIEGPGKKVLASVQYLPWQDGAAILLHGKLPLEGLLVFMDREITKKGGVVKLQSGQISHVLPLSRDQFNAWLMRFQSQSNMRVKNDPGRFIIQKHADEGASSPFMARIFLNILRLREQVYPDSANRERFDRLYDYMSSGLSNARDSAREIARLWTEHAEKVASGEIVEFVGRDVRINESIDKKLKSEVEAFLNSAARALKTGMQDIGKELGVNIGFLFKKQESFEKGVAELQKTDPDLATYIRTTREWSEPLMVARNDLEHSASIHQRMNYIVSGQSVTPTEPVVAGKPVTEFVEHTLDRLCCFVEEFSCHCLLGRMPEGITVTEVPLTDRPPEIPERFQITLVDGGRPPWRITYHASRFDQT